MNEQQRNTLDWDWIATLPKQHLSFIMHSIIPPLHLRPNPKLEEQVLEKLNLRTTDNSVELIGNMFEGTVLPTLCRRSDGKEFLDDPSTPLSMMVLNDHAVGEEGTDGRFYAYFQRDQSHNGFVRLTKSASDRFTTQVPDSTQHFVSAEKMSEMCFRPSFLEDEKVFVYAENTELTLQQIMNRQTIALPSPQWPHVAEAWKKRQRKSKWPPEEVIEEIVKGGCHIIPEAHSESVNKEIEWKFSFAHAQKKLAKAFSTNQLLCFLLFKILYYEYLDLPRFITPEHLLTLFLWECEKIPPDEWNSLNIATILLALIDELLYAIIDGKLPDYFIQEYNTIDFIPEEFEFNLLDKVSRLRQDPLTHLLNFASIYKFPFSPSKDWKTLSKPLLEDIEKLHEDLNRSVHEAFLPFADRLAACFFEEGKDKEIVHAYHFISSDILRGNHSVLALISNATQRIAEEDLNFCIQLMEFAKTEYPDDKHIYSLLGNLGCMYHSMANKAQAGSKERDEMLNKADEQFGLALSCPEASGATRMDYCNFLCNAQQRYADAVPLLLVIIGAEESKPQSGNVYDSAEIGNMDENIQQEIQSSEEKSVSMLSFLYAYYMLIEAYLKIGEHNSAMAILHKFHDCVYNLNKGKGSAIYFNLLGHSYMRLKDKGAYKKAEATFSMALRCKPNYRLAEEKRDECIGLQLSLIGQDDQEEEQTDMGIIPKQDGT